MGLVGYQRHHVLEAEASDASFSIAVILDIISDDGKRRYVFGLGLVNVGMEVGSFAGKLCEGGTEMAVVLLRLTRYTKK
jgi:hypothetical protein